VVRHPAHASSHGAVDTFSLVRVSVVINPVAGVGGGSLNRARRRAEQAFDLLTAEGAEPEILITERHGHARELAHGAVERGSRLVIAWGGDGTVNEVAAGLAFTDAALGIIPAGSGNGLARMLAMPADPRVALPRLVHGRDHSIDVGEANSRLFVNVAGVGFDAHVAGCFARLGRSRRGLLKYAAIVLTELGRYRPEAYTLELDAQAAECDSAFLLSFANGRQWGNGALIAPQARLDDGLLDAVLVQSQSRAAILRAVPSLFAGTIERVRGVTIRRIRAARVSADRPLAMHIDGETVDCGETLTVRVHPLALRLRQ
jgi:diacylglycerol kinase (ATP)